VSASNVTYEALSIVLFHCVIKEKYTHATSYVGIDVAHLV
jgi:general stress protein CsbA